MKFDQEPRSVGLKQLSASLTNMLSEDGALQLLGKYRSRPGDPRLHLLIRLGYLPEGTGFSDYRTSCGFFSLNRPLSTARQMALG